MKMTPMLREVNRSELAKVKGGTCVPLKATEGAPLSKRAFGVLLNLCANGTGGGGGKPKK